MVESDGSDFASAESISPLNRKLGSLTIDGEIADDVLCRDRVVNDDDEVALAVVVVVVVLVTVVDVPLPPAPPRFAAEAIPIDAALSNSNDVRKAGENTRQERRTENCSSIAQRGAPSGTLLRQSVSKRQRSLILLSFHDDDDKEAGADDVDFAISS